MKKLILSISIAFLSSAVVAEDAPVFDGVGVVLQDQKRSSQVNEAVFDVEFAGDFSLIDRNAPAPCLSDSEFEVLSRQTLELRKSWSNLVGRRVDEVLSQLNKTLEREEETIDALAKSLQKIEKNAEQIVQQEVKRLEKVLSELKLKERDSEEAKKQLEREILRISAS